MSNKIKYGLKNVHYSKITVEDGEVNYDTPKPIPGGVSLTLSPTGDTTTFPADDIPYFVQTANTGYSGELEIALIPDDFLTDIMGAVEDENGALLEYSNAITSEFAFAFEIQGDERARRTWFYRCSCARPNLETATKGTGIEPKTDKLVLTVMPRIKDNLSKGTLEKSEENTAKFNSFFSSVYEPVIAEG